MKKTRSAAAPNIAFTGEKDKKSPLRRITNGDVVISLPANQLKPFYHREAKTIIKLYGWLYKPVVSK